MTNGRLGPPEGPRKEWKRGNAPRPAGGGGGLAKLPGLC